MHSRLELGDQITHDYRKEAEDTYRLPVSPTAENRTILINHMLQETVLQSLSNRCSEIVRPIFC